MFGRFHPYSGSLHVPLFATPLTQFSREALALEFVDRTSKRAKQAHDFLRFFLLFFAES